MVRERFPRLERHITLPRISKGLESLPRDGSTFELFVLSGGITSIIDPDTREVTYRTTTPEDVDTRGIPAMGAWREKAAMLIAKNYPGVPITTFTWSAFDTKGKQPFPVSDAHVMKEEMIKDGVDAGRIGVNSNSIDTCSEMLEIVASSFASGGGHKAIITTSHQLNRVEKMLTSVLRMNDRDYQQIKTLIHSYDRRFFNHQDATSLRPKNTKHFLHILEELRELHNKDNAERLQHVYDNLHITLIPAEEVMRKWGNAEDIKQLAFLDSPGVQDEMLRMQKGMDDWDKGIYHASRFRRRWYNITHLRKRVTVNTYNLGKRGA